MATRTTAGMMVQRISSLLLPWICSGRGSSLVPAAVAEDGDQTIAIWTPTKTTSASQKMILYRNWMSRASFDSGLRWSTGLGLSGGGELRGGGTRRRPATPSKENQPACCGIDSRDGLPERIAAHLAALDPSCCLPIAPNHRFPVTQNDPSIRRGDPQRNRLQNRRAVVSCGEYQFPNRMGDQTDAVNYAATGLLPNECQKHTYGRLTISSHPTSAGIVHDCGCLRS